MELGYYAYLARTVPPWDLARAVARRAAHAFRTRFARGRRMLPHAARKHRPAERPGPGRHALLLPEAREATAQVLRERFPDACAAVVAEARDAREGRLPVFGKPTDCALAPRGREPTAPLAFHRDAVTHASYDADLRWDRINHYVNGSDVKAAWEVGRLSHLWRYGQARWLAPTAEERSTWAHAFLHTVRDFRARCPAGFGVQWCGPMEASGRAMHVALSYALVCDDPVFDPNAHAEVLALLDEHGAFVEENLEESGAVRTNHYAADLVGLVVLGSLFPELEGAARWRTSAARDLWAEIPRQVRSDGTHFESSTGYQRLCGELFLSAVLCARAAGLPPPPEVERAVSGLFRSLGELVKPSGRMPQIGDFDSSRGLPLHPRAALDGSYFAALGAAALCDPTLKFAGDSCPPEVAWLCGAAGVSLFDALPARARRKSRVLPEAGAAVLREASACLVLSAGPNGQGGCGGHAHNDKNSVELEWRGHDLIADRGTYVYARDPSERDARRSTAGHSTVQIDGAEQSRILPGRMFALPDLASARVLDLWHRDGVEVVRAQHHGYRRLMPGVTHVRSAALWRLGRAVAFVDELAGHGEHVLDLRWHVPQTAVRLRGASDREIARLQQLSDDKVVPVALDAIRCIEVSAAQPGEEPTPVALFAFGGTLPWRMALEDDDVSPGYGELAPARCVHLRAAGEMPATFCAAVLLL
jgi:hypothetical protein